jgi:hypothetical protein
MKKSINAWTAGGTERQCKRTCVFF